MYIPVPPVRLTFFQHARNIMLLYQKVLLFFFFLKKQFDMLHELNFFLFPTTILNYLRSTKIRKNFNYCSRISYFLFVGRLKNEKKKRIHLTNEIFHKSRFNFVPFFFRKDAISVCCLHKLRWCSN